MWRANLTFIHIVAPPPPFFNLRLKLGQLRSMRGVIFLTPHGFRCTNQVAVRGDSEMPASASSADTGRQARPPAGIGVKLQLVLLVLFLKTLSVLSLPFS